MQKKQVSVLVIDDDADLLDSICTMLRDAGFSNVVGVDSAAEAVGHITDHTVHLALVDLKLGNEDGLKVIEQLREHDRQICSVIITAFPSMESATEGMKLGTSDYLTKPITSDNLLAAVEKSLASRGISISGESNLNVLIGSQLRSARQRASLTTQQLADKVGISQSQISQIETGRSAASLATLYRIANALDVSLSELLEGV